MDISESQADRLFGDDRERSFDDVTLTHHLTISREKGGVAFETDSERYWLSESDVDQMVADCGWDTMWDALSETHKCLDYLQEHDA